MADEDFKVEYHVGWRDIDPNFHLRAAVLVDYAINTQFLWLEQYGITQARFAELGYEPVALKLEARYYKEATFGDLIVDKPLLTALSSDGARWKVRHHFVKKQGDQVVSILLVGTWMNWQTRKAIAPASDVVAALKQLPRSSNFEDLRSFIR